MADGISEVTLLVNGEAETQDVAIMQALRSAIEMSFGTFVSANTEILNDEIVKDEVATISTGNIKSYKELACVSTSNGYSVTIEAVVSIGKLISYAKSKGSLCEFAGQTFAMNMKLKKLNKENELKVMAHLKEQIKFVAPEVFDVSISAKNPKLKGNYYSIPLEIGFSANDASDVFINIVTKTLTELSLTENEIAEYQDQNIPIYKFSIIEKFDSWTYTHSYYFRNNLSGEVSEILRMPYENRHYVIHDVDGTEECSNPINAFVFKNRAAYPSYVDPELIPSTKVYPDNGYFPYFSLLRKQVRGIKVTNPATSGVGNCVLEWYTNDPVSPNNTLGLWGIGTSQDSASAALRGYLRSTVNPIFSISITCEVAECELELISGFTM